MSPRWTVFTGGEKIGDVGEAILKVEDGRLVFRDENGKIIVAYSETSWTAVREEDE